MNERATVYQVAGWDANFENNKSRERDRCSFVCVPNKLSGTSLTRLLSETDGTAVYGLFHLLLALCSQQKRPRQGWVTVDGTAKGEPLTTEELALRFRRPVPEVQRALDLLTASRIGWILRHAPTTATPSAPSGDSARPVPVECPPGARRVPARCRCGARPVPWKGSEGN